MNTHVLLNDRLWQNISHYQVSQLNSSRIICEFHVSSLVNSHIILGLKIFTTYVKLIRFIFCMNTLMSH